MDTPYLDLIHLNLLLGQFVPGWCRKNVNHPCTEHPDVHVTTEHKAKHVRRLVVVDRGLVGKSNKISNGRIWIEHHLAVVILGLVDVREEMSVVVRQLVACIRDALL